MNSYLETAVAENPSESSAAITVVELNAPVVTNVQSLETSERKAEAVKLLRQGIASAKAGNRQEARTFLLTAVQLDETSEAAWLWLASTSDQPTELYGFLHRVLEINPENARALEWSKATRNILVNAAISRGAALARENNRRDAAECFREATDYDSNSEIAWLWLASVTDEIEDKLAYLGRILSINPNNEKAAASFHATKRQMARALLKKGNMAAVSGDRETAREILRDVMEYDSGLEEAWLLQAYLTDSIEEKAEYFRKTLEINEENAQAAAGLASLQAMRQLREAEVETTPAVKEETRLETSSCPFCDHSNSINSVRCTNCKAFVAIDDVEKFLVNDAIEDGVVRAFIEHKTSEQSERELSVEEYLNLGFAYFNLRNFKKGASYLEQVLELNEIDENLKNKIEDFLEKLQEIAPEALNGVASSGKTIMVVDDSPTVRKLIVGKLEKHGHRVVSAVDGMDALGKINGEKPDLILLDVTMPRLDGYQLCKLVKSNSATKHIPVVMISGKDGFFDKVRGRMAGSTAYITKPFGPETLLQTVETYCS